MFNRDAVDDNDQFITPQFGIQQLRKGLSSIWIP